MAASTHGKGTGNVIRFDNAAKYYAFGFRDGGKVTAVKVTCDGKVISAIIKGLCQLTDMAIRVITLIVI